jgi:hypothetical protein
MYAEQAVSHVGYRYALLPPLDWGEDCDAELRKANQLWNVLIEIEHSHRQEVRQVAAADDEVTACRAEYEAAAGATDALAAQRKAIWAAARRRLPTPDLDAEIALARAHRIEVAQRLKAARRRAYQDHRGLLRALEGERRAAVKRARQNSGLHFGTYNAVIQAHEFGRQYARKSGAEMRFRRFDGTGRIVQQIINGMSIEELFIGARSQAGLGSDPRGKSDKIRALRIAVYTRAGNAGGRIWRHVTWPIVWHRDLPVGARIQQIAVHKTTRGGRTLWHAVFFLRVPGAPKPSTEGSRIAINPGWRQTPAGIRVATILAVPDQKHDSAATLGYVFVPTAVLQRLERCEQDTAARDGEISRILAWLRTLNLATAPEQLAKVMRDIIRAPRIGPRSLYRLMHFWRSGYPDRPGVIWRQDWFAHFAGWHAADKIIWRDREERRAWAIGRRREHYRLEARRWLHGAREIVLNEHDMAGTAKAEGSELPPPARARRVMAAPSEFRAAVLEYAQRAGIAITVRAIKNNRCAHCGELLTMAGGPRLIWQCPNHHVIDQDENYCRLLVSAPPAGERRDGPDTGSPARTGEKQLPSGLSAGGRWARLKALRAASEMDKGRPKSAPQALAGEWKTG